MQASPFEAATARKFRVEAAPTILAQAESGAPIAFTRLCGTGPFRGQTLAVPPEDAYTIPVVLAPTPPVDVWFDGKHHAVTAATPGIIGIYDLTTSTRVGLNPPYDYVRVHMPVAAMDRIAYERGLRRPNRLRPHAALDRPDPVLLALAHSVLPMIAAPETGTKLFLDSVALAFHAHILHRYGGTGAAEPSRSGLAPWQLRRAYAFIEAHLDGDPSIAELAEECRLSPSHFARAFRQATGLPPHRWLLQRRVERAKELLVDAAIPLAQVAVACGFVDQSHLNRVFTRAEGNSPGRWRRLRCS